MNTNSMYCTDAKNCSCEMCNECCGNVNVSGCGNPMYNVFSWNSPRKCCYRPELYAIDILYYYLTKGEAAEIYVNNRELLDFLNEVKNVYETKERVFEILQDLLDKIDSVTASCEWDDIKDKPSFAIVATSGDYSDLNNKPKFKTFNGKSILGEGNIEVVADVDNHLDGDSENPVQNKVVTAEVETIKGGSNKSIAALDAQDGALEQRVGNLEQNSYQKADWNESDSTKASFIKNKPAIPDVSNKADKATTLAGYGITDGYTKTEGQALESEVDDRLDAQDAAIALLNGSEVIVVADHTDATEVPNPDPQKIYREYGTNSYTDYMCVDATTTPVTWQALATYSYPGVDNEPTANSVNLVKSGGVYESVKAVSDKIKNVDSVVASGNEEEITITNNNNEVIVTIDNSGVDAKALLVQGVPVITDISDKASREYVDEELGQKQDKMEGLHEETAQTRDKSIDFTTDANELCVRIDADGIKAKKYYDINGNEMTFSLSNYDKKNTLFEPYFYSVKKGRTNNQYGEGTGWYDRFVICHISDTHQYNSLIREAITLSKNKSNVIINTGDDANGNANTSNSSQITELNATKNTVISANPSVPYMVVPGNHDVANVTKKQYSDIMCALTGDYSANVVWGDAAHYRAYGYVDVPSASNTFRIILLDPFDYNDADFPNTRAFQSAVFSQEQIDWFIATLKSAATNGYHVITAMHYSFGDNSLRFNEEKAKPDALYYQDSFMIPDIIDAFQKNTTLRRTYSDSKNIDNIVIDEDFTNAGTLNYVCHLFGHIHSKNHYRCQKPDGSKIYDIAMFGEAALGAYGNALNKAYRLSGTVNDIACSLLAVDTVEKCIYRVAYGSYMNYDNSETNRIEKVNYSFNN